MSNFRHLVHLGTLIGLAAAVPAMAADVTHITNTATLGFDVASGRQTISSNTVTLDVPHAKRPTTLSFRLLPVGYQLTGLKCETSPLKFTPAPIDVATYTMAPKIAALDVSEPLILVLDNQAANHDPNTREKSSINVMTPTMTGTVELMETGPDTGIFAGGVPANGGGNPAIAPCDVTRARGADLTLSFTEDEYSMPSTASILVDPAGYLFDSTTAALINGATVTLLDDSDQPAEVFGDDGISRYPSTVMSGSRATDASGRTYVFPTGNYRFPYVAPGTYHLRVEPPAGYTAPSTRSVADLAKLQSPIGTPFLINGASFDGRFTLDTPEPFFSDIPLDPIGAASLLLTKTASVREASPGDFVQYLVSVTNRGTGPARNVHLTDILPPGLRYERGSTRGVSEAVPSADGRNLDFTVPAIPAGQRADVSYVVSVAPGAPVGEALNRVLASGSTGATSNEAAASVRITPLLFTNGFTLIGRVTEGDCSNPNSGRIGIRGIRLVLEDGTFVVTDKDGYYHVEGVRPGRHVVQLDTNSLPASYKPVACDSDTRTAGSAISRFVEAQGGLLKRVDFQLRPTGLKAIAANALPITVASDSAAAGDHDWFAGQTAGIALLFPTADTNPRAPVTRVVVKHLPGQRVALSVNGQPAEAINFDTTDVSPDKTVAVSSWSGIGLKDGNNTLVARVLDAGGNVVTTLERTVHSSTAAVSATYAADKSRLVADGLTRPLIAVRVIDRDGRPVRNGTVVPFTVDAPYTAAIDAELAQRRPLEGRGRAAATARVTGDDGLAFIALEPTTQAGAVHLSVALAEDKQVRTSDIRAWLAGAARDWMIVGFGAGTVGYDTLKSHASTLPRGVRGGVVSDGQIAFYAKGRIKGSWLATIAYDSDRSIDRTRGLLGTIDPNAYYTVYGDGTQQGYDAATQRKLYLRLERRNLYALLGDFETGLTDTQLTRYSRTLNGVKAEYQGNRILFSAFAANTDQLYGRDEIQGNGLSGPYRLSGRDIVPNSDKLRIETRDRVRPELILSTTQMTRHIDYDIDPSAGTIRFREPVLGRDPANNPVFIVVDYETEGSTRKRVAGGRTAVRLAKGRATLGASLLHDETNGTATVAGLDLKAKPTANTEIRGEYATGGKLGLGTGRAWLAEAEIHARHADMLIYGRSQDLSFGLGQQNIVEAGTRKFGIDGRVALADKLALTLTAWNATQLDGPGSRAAAETRLEYRRARGTLFIGGTYADDRGIDGQDRHSRLLTLGGTQDLLNGKLTIGAQTQIAPGGAKDSVDFPLRQQVTAALRVSKGVRLLAGYEISQGKDFTANTARVGFDVAPWKGAKLMSTINQQAATEAAVPTGNTSASGGENGQRIYAQYGLNQSLQLTKRWNLDLTLDANTTLRGKVPTGALVNAFASTANTPIAGQYGNDGDYVAATIGGGYRAKRWSWNGRLEYRHSDASNRWTVTSDMLRSLGEGRTLAASVHYSDLTDTLGKTASSGTADLALALRPQDSRWSLLERLQFRNDHADSGITDTNVIGIPAVGGGFQATLRVINNIALNYRTGPEGAGHGFEATVYYGAKWVRGSFGSDDYTGYIDVLALDLRHDLGRRFDVGVQGSVQHAWDRGSIAFSGGPSVGVSPAQNVWVSAGYNVAGYRDSDFEADRYTRAGSYVTARLKFDQWSLGRAGRTIFGGAK